MTLIDIEKAIVSENVNSRFRLVSIASQRAKELNNLDGENMTKPQSTKYTKVTTNALNEIVENKIVFSVSIKEDPKNSVEEKIEE